MTRPRTLRLIPWLLALHSAEEGATIAAALPTLHARLPDTAARLTAVALTPHRFYVALTLLTALGFAIPLLGSVEPPRSRSGYLLLALQATLLLNVVSHAATAAWLGGYVPGLATAVLVNLPFSVYVLGRAWTEQWYGRRALLALLPFALLLHGPLLAGAIALIGS